MLWSGSTLADWRKTGPNGDAGNDYNSDSGRTSDSSAGVVCTIDSNARGGVRLTRLAEPMWVKDLTFESTVTIPVGGKLTGRNESVMLWELKGKKHRGEGSDPFWAIELENNASGELVPRITWFGGQTRAVAGPTASDGVTTWRELKLGTKPVPVGRPFNIKVAVSQSSGFTGSIAFYIDGDLFYSASNIRTGFPDADADIGNGTEFAVTWYSDGYTPSNGASTSSLIATNSVIRAGLS